MGHTALNPDEETSAPKSLAERLIEAAKLEALGEPAEEEAIPTAASMAQRFAPESKTVTAPDLSTVEFPAPPLVAQSFDRILAPRSSRWRALIGLLILLSLTPPVVLGVLIWQGLVEVPPFITELGAKRLPASQAALALPPKLETVLPKQDHQWSNVAIKIAPSIEVEAGSEIPFDVAIDSEERLPARAVLTVHGLPEGASFSKGRPYGASEWTLTPEETDGLTLQMPKTADGSADLDIKLVTADGAVMANASARLTIAADPKAALILRPEDRDRIAELIAHGQKMIDVGYFAGARAYYKRAAEAGSGEAALALGATYDPAFLAQVGAHGIQADLGQAKFWYERARELGVMGADEKIRQLRSGAPEPGATSESVGWAPVSTGATSEQANAQPVAAKAEPAANAEGEWVELTVASNLREGPSSNSKTVRIVAKGTKLRVIGREGSWVQVNDPETEQTAWVYSGLLVGEAAGAR